MEKFVPQSPDPFLNQDADMSLAKFGHINAIVDELNTTNNTIASAKNNVYANNVAALAGGLSTGDFYRTATGEIRIVV
jgi:hypothetical protein